MPFEMTREDFLLKAGLTEQDWQKSCLKWEELFSIANHHEMALGALALHGGKFANRIQAFTGVHSVRWRVKDTFGLLKKIVRKNLEKKTHEKWKTISLKNYRSVVSDLIGVRALHLLREDCIIIDEQLRATYEVYDVTVFKRSGDPELSEITQRGAVEKLHDVGYRSIHYGFDYTGEKEPVTVEFQVRTVFQEGWSEIDHKVRYPDFSKNELLKYYIGLFNGLAGTADDMGSFVLKLHELISTTAAAMLKSEISLATKDSAIEKLEQEINKLKSEGTIPQTAIDSLQNSVNEIKEENTKESSQALISRVIPGIYTPNSDDMKKIRNLAYSFSPDASLLKAIDKLSKPNQAFAEMIENATRPNAAIAKMIEDATRPNAALAAALEDLNKPNAAIAAAMEEINRPNSAIKAALDNFNRPSAAITAAMEEINRKNANITAALDQFARPRRSDIINLENHSTTKISTTGKVNDTTSSTSRDKPESTEE